VNKNSTARLENPVPFREQFFENLVSNVLDDSKRANEIDGSARNRNPAFIDAQVVNVIRRIDYLGAGEHSA
jgi:hypothetical protein